MYDLGNDKRTLSSCKPYSEPPPIPLDSSQKNAWFGTFMGSVSATIVEWLGHHILQDSANTKQTVIEQMNHN